MPAERISAGALDPLDQSKDATMARDGLPLLLCAGVLLGAVTSPAAAGDSPVTIALAVQSALQRGREFLRAGDYPSAVAVLESQIARIDGSREYLVTLRDAYRGHIKNLRLARRDKEADLFANRLAILERGPSLDGPPQPAPASARPVKAPAPPPVQARAKIDQPPPPRPTASTPAADKDPFALANHKRLGEARDLLARAEEAFRGNHFAEAGELFARANEAVPEVTRSAAERWGYCKLFGVQERLRQQDRTLSADELNHLEQEVRAAMAMTPKFKEAGQARLTFIQERRSAAAALPGIAVKHSHPSGSAWAVAETANFRIFHNQEPGYAEKVAQVAERTRTAMQKKWFGTVEAPWNPRCDIYLHATAEAYSQATKVPANVPGHAHMKREGSRILARQIDLHVDEVSLLVSVLPHEATHVVLAGRFGPIDLPRWADEGMAVLTEPRDRVERHLRNLPRYREAGQLFSVRQLLAIEDWPEAHRISAFYAQSVSLVDYLCQLRGPQAFTQFLDESGRRGYEAALKRHYGLQDFADLERRWLAQAFKEGVARRP